MLKLLDLFRFSDAASWFWGDWDGLFRALITFVVVEYITATLVALSERKLSNQINLKGLSKKVALLLLVGTGHIVDVYLTGGGNAFRTMTILFYISCEGIALLENAAALGLPIPKEWMDFFKQLNHKADDAE